MQNKKKQIFLDLDGVILDFHKGFSIFLKNKYSIEIKGEDLEQRINTCHINNNCGDLFSEAMFDDFFVSSYFSSLKMLISKDEYFQVSRNYPIWFITNLSEKYKKYRIQNLKMHKLNYQDIFFAGFEKYDNPDYPDKSDIINHLKKPDTDLIFLDDLAINCKNVKNSIPNTKVFLLDKPYNRNNTPTGCVRVKNWQDFIKQIAQ